MIPSFEMHKFIIQMLIKIGTYCLVWQVFYVVDKPTQDWKGGKGFLSKDVLLKGLPSPSDDALILVPRLQPLPLFVIRTRICFHRSFSGHVHMHAIDI